MNNYSHIIAFYLLTSFCLGLSAGCGDHLLPDEGTTSAKERVIVTVANPELGGMENSHVVSININTLESTEIAQKTFASSPASHNGLITLMDYSANAIKIFDVITGAQKGANIPILPGWKFIDYSLALNPSRGDVAYRALQDDPYPAWEGVDSSILLRVRWDGTIVYTDTTLAETGTEKTFLRFTSEGRGLAYFIENISQTTPMPYSGKLYSYTIGDDYIDIFEQEINQVPHSYRGLFEYFLTGLVYVDSENNDLYITDPSRMRPTKRIGSGFGPAGFWSRDSSVVIFTQPDRQLAVYNVYKETTTPLGIYGIFPRWSSDGTKIVYCEVPRDLAIDYDNLLKPIKVREMITGQEKTIAATTFPFAFWGA